MMSNSISATHPCLECELFTQLFGPLAICQDCERVLRPERPFVAHEKIHRTGGHAEQIGRGGRGRPRHSSKSRVFEKNRASRLRRRAEKRDPENAPTRFIKYWYD